MDVIDRAALLAWLDDLADQKPLVVAATLEGLAARIRRGDFDVKEDA